MDKKLWYKLNKAQELLQEAADEWAERSNYDRTHKNDWTDEHKNIHSIFMMVDRLDSILGIPGDRLN